MRRSASTTLLFTALVTSATPAFLAAQTAGGNTTRRDRSFADQMRQASVWVADFLGTRTVRSDQQEMTAGVSLDLIRRNALESRSPTALYREVLATRAAREDSRGGLAAVALSGASDSRQVQAWLHPDELRARDGSSSEHAFVSDHLANDVGAPAEHPWVSDHVGGSTETPGHPWVSDHVGGSTGGNTGGSTGGGSTAGDDQGGTPVSATPEPATLALLATGLVLVGVAVPRHRARAARAK